MTIDNDKRTGRGPNGWRKLALVSSLLIAGVAGVGAFAQGGGGHGWGPGGRGGGEAMMKTRADRVLRSVDATPEQRARIEAIMGKAIGDLAPVRASFGGTRGQFADIVGAERIDRDAAERLRAERIATADQASRRMLTAALDAAEVLTPAQRAKLKARFDQRGRS